MRRAQVHRNARDWAVVAAGTGGWVTHRCACVIEIHVRSPLFIAAFPPADAANTVVLRPIGKRIVGGVHGNKPAASGKVRLEISFRFGRPTLAVVVTHHHVVISELGSKPTHVLVGRR